MAAASAMGLGLTAVTPDARRAYNLGSGVDGRIKAECVEIAAIDALKPNTRNAKKHPPSQIARLQENFEAFGFTTPLLVDEHNVIIAAHARFEAANALASNICQWSGCHT